MHINLCFCHYIFTEHYGEHDTMYQVVRITIILCNNVSFYRYRVSPKDGSMPCDRPVNVLLYLLFYYCAKVHLLLLCH